MRAEGAAWSERERRFRLMFEAHYQAIHNYSVRRVESDHDAGDVAAEVFTTVWRRIDDVPPSPNELPWLYGVARRTISDLRRSQSRRASLVHRLRISRQPEVSPSSSDDPSHDRLLAAMAALPPDDCEALRLVLWEQLSHADTALVLDCSVNAVGIRIHRAKKRLRASLLPGTISEDERARSARFQSPVASSRDLRRSAVIAARIPNGRRRKYLVSALGIWFRGSGGSITCPDLSHCYALIQTGALGAYGPPGILATEDGGTTWSVEQPFSPPNPQWDGLSSISCPTANACWITGSEQSSTDPALTQGAMFATLNGGQTWLPVQLPAGLGSVNQVECATEPTCLAIGQPPVANGVVTSRAPIPTEVLSNRSTAQ